VMFRSQAKLLRFRPDNGMLVVLRGRVTIYEDRGELQISAEYLEPKGAGALQIAFEQLKAKLEAEGLFDPGRKKPIPALPRQIGIVTSPQAAALRDILNILRRRHHSANVVIFPAQVQGEAAAPEVSAGVRYFNKTRNVEVIIVARGGGSAEDLAAFNHEGLARTIAASRIPVIAAIGHETDFTIIDFVADLRAPTPSAAAELVIRSRRDVEDQAQAIYQRLLRAVHYRLVMARQALTELSHHRAFGRMMNGINQRQQKLDDLNYRLERAERRILELHRRKWEIAAAAVRHYDVRAVLAGIGGQLTMRVAALGAATQNLLLRKRGHFDRLLRQIEALSPLAVLNRGYALIFNASGVLLRDASKVSIGDEISARVATGTLNATVKKSSSEP
jgi:exodeoxyribonuclease VII large subunit